MTVREKTSNLTYETLSSDEIDTVAAGAAQDIELEYRRNGWGIDAALAHRVAIRAVKTAVAAIDAKNRGEGDDSKA